MNLKCQIMNDTIAEKIKNSLIKGKNSILSELNESIIHSPIIYNFKKDFLAGIIDTDNITYSSIGNEEALKISVDLGKNLESVIPRTLKKYGIDDVKKFNDSIGDIKVEGVSWEIKGTSSVNNTSWTGATHSTGKEHNTMNFIGVRYQINKNVNLLDVYDRKSDLITNLIIVVIEELKFNRNGIEKNNSSYTCLQIPVENYQKVEKGLVCGKIKKNQKYLKFIFE